MKVKNKEKLVLNVQDSISASNNIIEVIDANNNKFMIDANSFNNILEDAEGSTSVNLEDNDKATISYTPIIVDSENNEVANINDIIQDIENNNSEVMAIDVTFEATHSGKNLNNYVYNSEDLEDAVGTWMTPYKKPLLKNHDMHSEPLGRIVDSYFGPSEITDERDTINTTFRVVDKDAMVKFLDRRYNTVSIGASVSNVRCNICGKDILKDGAFKFCGHWKGEVYNGEKAYWTAKGFNYKECSVVNSPADQYAQIKKIKVVKKSDKSNDSIGDSNEEENILDSIDDIIKDNTSKDNNSVEDNSKDVATNNEDSSNNENPKVNDFEETISVEKYNEVLADMKKKNEEIEKLNAKVTDLNDKVADLNLQIERLENHNDMIQRDSEKNRENFLSVSIMYKKSIIDSIISEKAKQGLIKDEECETERENLLADSTKSLKELLVSLRDKNTTREIPVIENPSLADNTKGNVISEEDDENNEDKKVTNNKRTLADMEKEFLMMI